MRPSLMINGIDFNERLDELKYILHNRIDLNIYPLSNGASPEVSLMLQKINEWIDVAFGLCGISHN